MSIIQKLYEAHAHPFVRVVHGALMSWDPNTAVITYPNTIHLAVWSQCSNFIAISQNFTLKVDILDSATHQQLQTLEPPHNISISYRALVFSPDSRMLTCFSEGRDWYSEDSDTEDSDTGDSDTEELSVVSWDLQTGGIVSIIKSLIWRGLCVQMAHDPSITYLTNGRMVGVCYCYDSPVISIYDVVSGVHVRSYSLDSPVWDGNLSPGDGLVMDDGSVSDGRSVSDGCRAEDSSLVSNNLAPSNGSSPNNGQICHVSSTGKVLRNIWVHGNSLRFATLGPTTITIWEVGFALGTPPTEVETLFLPDNVRSALPSHSWFDKDDPTKRVEFFPTLSRLAIVSQGKVLVWDARNSKSLLSPTDARCYPGMSFSSDGRFFACNTTGYENHLWKESPTGYVLHGSFTYIARSPNLLLSPNGESIVTFERAADRAIRLWDTKNFTVPPSSISTQTLRRAEDFVLDFSPDRTSAVVARKEDSVVAVLDLKSGAPQLDIEAGICIYGLRVIENSVAVVGNGKVFAWDLPAGDRIPNARVNVDDSTRAIDFGSEWRQVLTASISSDYYHVALVESDTGLGPYLRIYSASTGKYLGFAEASRHAPQFTPDGRGVWCVSHTGGAEVWTVPEDGPAGSPLVPRVDVEHPPEGYPWGSSRGYQATDDGWIVGPGGKRLLMLPPPWQSSVSQRVWNGQFLALLHGTLPEPVILELDL